MQGLIPMQRRYWNDLADEYQGITRIATDDFHYGPQLPGERDLKLLPPLAPGQRALELGCGAAQNSLWLARQGLDCTALDLSREQLRHARTLAARHNLALHLVEAPIEHWREHVPGVFDLIHSAHALEFVDAPDAVLAGAAERLVPGGTLVFSTVHPLYQGEWIEACDDDADEGVWGEFLRNYFEPPDDVRSDDDGVLVIARAYPVSRWFRWLREAGLDVTGLLEPPAVPEGATPPYSSDDWAEADGELHAIPGTLICVARKPACAAQPHGPHAPEGRGAGR